ncbi:Mu-like prophage major head subunit gpT family protein [Pseudomonas sp. D47]|uniref:Mu-like prophage major head subunit gpT family protein n=1 Tax=Pseudomonas sp. D47 TaxID=3159447 RepID=UPI00387AB4F4
MLVNKASIQAAFVSLKTIFNNAFAAAPTTWAKIAMKVPSTTGQNDYAWLSNFPKMRQWIGAKHVKNLSAAKYSIVNDDFEATVEVDRNHIEDDQLGIYQPQAKMAGFSSAQLPDEIVYGAVNGGFTSLCHDGQYFFDTDHPVGEKLVSNKGTAPLSVASKAAAMAGYGKARAAMKQFKDDEGRSLNINPNVLLVGPAMEDTARALLTEAKFDDKSANIYRNTAELVVDGRIESDTAWYLLDTTKPVMPFVYQERKAPVFVQQTNPEADDVFNQRKYKFGAEARGAAGYGFWQLAFGSTGTGSL